jgi:hypothetical protein
MTNTITQPPKRHILAITVVAVVVAAGLYLVLLRNPMETILSLLSDDAFYYFKIAQNIANGDGCTFDGIAPTNGFHPAWMLVNVAVFRIAGSNLVTPVQVIIILNILVCVATFVLLYRLVDRYVAPGYALVTVAACLLPNILTGMINGLETGLMMLMVSVLLRLAYKTGMLELSASRSSALGLGALLGVITLCRLDSVFLFLAAVAMTAASILVRKHPFKDGLVRLALIGGGFGLVVAPYFIWNLASFGHLSPISGTVKSTFPVVSAEAFQLGGDKMFGALMLALIAAFLGLVFWANKSRKRESAGAANVILSSPLALVTFACLLHFGHTVLFLEWGVYWWHYALYGLTLALALARLAYCFTARRAWTKRLALIGLVAPMVALALLSHERILRIKGLQHAGWLEGAEWARDNTPPGTVFACLDAGLIGYFSQRPVINLDGKANGYEFLRHLRDGDIHGYLTAKNTAYLIRVRGRYYDGFTRVTMPRANQPNPFILVSEVNEVFRSSQIPSHVGRIRAAANTHLFVWEYVPYLTAPGRQSP